MSEELSDQNCKRCGKPLTCEEEDGWEEDEEPFCSACQWERMLEVPTFKEAIIPGKMEKIEALVAAERQKVDQRKRKAKELEEPRHTEHWICLYDKAFIKKQKYPEHYKDMNRNTRARIMKILKSGLSRCPNCGGFQPELAFLYNDTIFTFTCTKIMGKGKVVETDYDQFARYLLAKGYGKAKSPRTLKKPDSESQSG